VANIKGKNFDELARANFTMGSSTAGILVVRTDGKVLLRFTSPDPTAYTLFTHVGRGIDRSQAHSRLRCIAAIHNYKITKEA